MACLCRLRGLSRNFKRIFIQLKLVNETITSKAYQDNIKSDIKFQYESRVNILKRYCKVRYLVECLGYSAFILEFYIAINIILICLTGDCFINKLKLRDTFKSYEIVPSIRIQCLFLPIHQCNVDKFVRVSDARWE